MLSDVVKSVAVEKMFPAECCEVIDLARLRLRVLVRRRRRLAIAVGARVGDVVGQKCAAVFKQSLGLDLVGLGWKLI